MSPLPRTVVVGNGMAGGRFVEDLLALDPGLGAGLTVIGDEAQASYNRVLLSSVLAGTHGAGDVALHDRAWYARRGARLHLGTRATRIDRDARTVSTDDGAVHPYDHLVLATGSSPVLPPLKGLRTRDGALLPGTWAFRTLADCTGIAADAAGATRAIVVGGGLLGLEAARGLLSHGVTVEVVHGAERLMEAQLDADGARVLRRVMRRLGVDSYLSARAVGVVGDDRVTGLRLDDDMVLDCDLLIFACGIRPRTALAAEAGFDVRRGIVVGDDLRTATDPRVLAIGECAEHEGRVYGLVAPSWDQAAVAAQTVALGTPRRSYRGSTTVTRLKAMGVEVAAMGDTTADPHDDSVGAPEVLQFIDPVRGTYKKLVVSGGRLLGAVLMGDVATVATVTQAFDRQSVLPPDRLHLLFESTGAPVVDPALLDDDATVCQCNGVSAGALRACARRGEGTVAEVAASTRATTGCGTCKDTVRALLEGATITPQSREAVIS